MKGHWSFHFPMQTKKCTSILNYKITLSIIKLREWRFQAFHDVFLFHRLIKMSHDPRIKTYENSHWYILQTRWNTIGYWIWNISTQERKVSDIEIIVSVINWSVKFTVPPDWQLKIYVRAEVLLSVVSWSAKDTSGSDSFQVLVVYRKYIIDVPVREI